LGLAIAPQPAKPIANRTRKQHDTRPLSGLSWRGYRSAGRQDGAWHRVLASGLAIAEMAEPGCPVTVGLPRMSLAEAVAAARGRRCWLCQCGRGDGRGNGGLLPGSPARRAACRLGLHARLPAIPRYAPKPPGFRCSTCANRPLRSRSAPGAGAREPLLTVGTDCSRQDVFHAGDRARTETPGVAADFRATGRPAS
jgi:hypothetical protein